MAALIKYPMLLSNRFLLVNFATLNQKQKNKVLIRTQYDYFKCLHEQSTTILKFHFIYLFEEHF